MRLLLPLLLLSGCKIAPDYVEFHALRGDTEGMTGAREMDSETDTFGVTLGYVFSKPALQERDREFLRSLYESPRPALEAPKPDPAPAPAAPPAPSTHEPAAVPPEDPKKAGAPWWAVLAPTATTLALGILGYLNKSGRVDWVSPKHPC